MSRSIRIAAVASAGALLALAGSAHAATSAPTKLVVTDPSGDKAVAVGAGDLTKVTYTTTGSTTKVAGKSVYTPKNLVITLETADAIATAGHTQYEVDADLDGCGSFSVYATPGVDGSEGGSVGCGGSGSLDPIGLIPDESRSLAPIVTVGAKTISFSISFKDAPDVLKAGAKIVAPAAFTAEVDPLFGFIGPYLVTDSGGTDFATTDSTYKIG